MRTYDKCLKTFPNKSSLRKHRRHVLKIPAYLFVLDCNVCHKIELSVSEMDKNFRKNHGTQLEKICVYCGVGFDNPDNFYKHMIEKHDMPAPADSGRNTAKPISSVFDGALKVFKHAGSRENGRRRWLDLRKNC